MSENGDGFQQPWDVIADFFVGAGYDLREARDRTILAWLKDGNTDPYCDWVGRGHTPSHRVAFLVARMMQKAKAPEAGELSDLPLGLAISGDRRALPDKEGETRKFLGARHSLSLIEQAKRSGKTSIIARADEEAAKLASDVPLANNVTIGPSTIRQVRMQLQRGLKNSEMPEIMCGLFCFD
ncbi:hypothetical protein SAMN04488061_2792 [Filomicrobium insigne]|uniref:Uncharacterized protein n=1 Tax=Filomicrobium insigne TaxID=418854 RepID=A0A1H0S9E0_9HYPH|nr:hypothetical protein [Filomicrobium insigne]SDP38374.1 hypothetical protein SAMN04488061_2792 [Filomicrobium insigne]